MAIGLGHLIMGVRCQSSGEEAAGKLRKEFPSASIAVWVVDMALYTSVRAIAAKCAGLERIDLIMLNAGLIKSEFTVSPETQNEPTLQVNYLSTMLLAVLLLPILKAKKIAGATPVLSVIGSDLSYHTTIEFPWYKRTKLLQIMFVSKLAEYISPEHVIIHARMEQALLSRSVHVAASTYVDAVLAQGTDSHGSFVCDWTIKPYPPFWYSSEGKDFRSRLWDETMAELEFAGVLEIVESVEELHANRLSHRYA
ncbi:hypothetical protein B0I35DRAFT_471944 [Stachybotrys elegans]|uniref:Uncharacterized protein n=1 Tax=Stachybotrys elegans TaxID=80388 RepID=A0A8K0SES9_9HYPO|nr:hypothetical protein B0I35DRAFT_471944 [Stachybotrys elegans]